MNEQLATTSTLLTVVAIATAVQALIAAGLVIAGFVAYARIRRRVDELQREAAPLVARVTHVLDRVERAEERVGRMASTVLSKAVPAIGLFRGARTALNVLLR